MSTTPLEGTLVPARSARAVQVHRGQAAVITDVAGQQVADVWALCDTNGGEYLSTSHTRSALRRLFPRVGETFVTNRRRPVLTLVEDTSPGYHDALFAACNKERYEELGVSGHPNCEDNFFHATDEAGLTPGRVPDPVNIFQCTPVAHGPDGPILGYAAAQSKPGDSVTLRAERDVWLIVSACSMDLSDLNGGSCSDLLVSVVPAGDTRTEEKA